MRLLLLAAAVAACLAAGAHGTDSETAAAAAGVPRVVALLPPDRTPLRLYSTADEFDDDSKVSA